jgi:magnesium transporter
MAGCSTVLTIFDTNGAGLTQRQGLEKITPATVWIDLVNPTPEEDRHVEAALAIEIPTRAEAREIEVSNRFYSERGANYMTAYIMYNIEQSNPGTSNITFIIAGDRLVTVRYVEPKAFPFFLARIERGEFPCQTGQAIMIGLIETFIHRKADLIERIQDDVDKMAQGLFGLNGMAQPAAANAALGGYLKGTGRDADIIARAQESAVSIDRSLAFFAGSLKDRPDAEAIVLRIKDARRDNSSLMEHMKFLQGRTNFLLDATLGMINSEQNQIIKLFSVMAVMLMPPTLVASLYGMNFKHMPELDWQYGYPMAIVLMILSGVVPYLYFKRKGWL